MRATRRQLRNGLGTRRARGRPAFDSHARLISDPRLHFSAGSLADLLRGRSQLLVYHLLLAWAFRRQFADSLAGYGDGEPRFSAEQAQAPPGSVGLVPSYEGYER